MRAITIVEIINFLKENDINFCFRGNDFDTVIGFSSLKHYKEGTVTWVKNPLLLESKSDTVNMQLIITEFDSNIEAKNVIETYNSKESFFSILQFFWGEEKNKGIADDSVVLTNKIGNNVSIGHHCVIGKDVVIEDNVQIGNNVQIECSCHVGKDTIIHSGAILGTDGFGYYQNIQGYYEKVPHFGGIYVGKNVEIGANTCIDRGTIDDTYIGDNVKIDNLCHIAHNVRIGENSLVIALSLIGGSADLGRNVYVAPGCLIKNQINIEQDAFIGMGAVVLNDVPQNKVVVGVPAKVTRNNIAQ